MRRIFDVLWRHKKPIFISFCLSFLFGIVLMGAPGFGVMELNERIILPIFFGEPYMLNRLPADSAWPTAIILSMLMPWFVSAFLAFFKRYMAPLNRFIRIVFSVFFTLVVLCVLYLIAFPLV